MTMRSVFFGLFFASLTLFTFSAKANTFAEDLEQVDDAIKNNPSHVLRQSLESCLQQRNLAVSLNSMGMEVRAQRALDYCFDVLKISRQKVKKVSGPTLEELQAKASLEYEKALTLTPDAANGLKLYRECAACHLPEGWGSITGSVAQIAGQHRKVIIKQLADFRAGNRESVLMAPYASVEYIGGTQSLADVAEYVSTLEISVDNGKGPGTDLELGEKLYQQHCKECHGANGEGNNDNMVPRIQAQHYKYLVRMFEWIRDGKRRNASEEMVALSKELTGEEMRAVMDYTSRLLPPEELRAPENWKNPDFE